MTFIQLQNQIGQSWRACPSHPSHPSRSFLSILVPAHKKSSSNGTHYKNFPAKRPH